jgi:hypothetical protein
MGKAYQGDKVFPEQQFLFLLFSVITEKIKGIMGTIPQWVTLRRMDKNDCPPFRVTLNRSVQFGNGILNNFTRIIPRALAYAAAPFGEKRGEQPPKFSE